MRWLSQRNSPKTCYLEYLNRQIVRWAHERGMKMLLKLKNWLYWQQEHRRLKRYRKAFWCPLKSDWEGIR